jgi:hypothetical protein
MHILLSRIELFFSFNVEQTLHLKKYGGRYFGRYQWKKHATPSLNNGFPPSDHSSLLPAKNRPPAISKQLNPNPGRAKASGRPMPPRKIGIIRKVVSAKEIRREEQRSLWTGSSAYIAGQLPIHFSQINNTATATPSVSVIHMPVPPPFAAKNKKPEPRQVHSFIFPVDKKMKCQYISPVPTVHPAMKKPAGYSLSFKIQQGSNR